MLDPDVAVALPRSAGRTVPVPERFDVVLVAVVGTAYTFVLLGAVGQDALAPVGLAAVMTLVPLLWRTHAPLIALAAVMVIQSAAFVVVPGFTPDAAEITFVSVLIALGAVAARRPAWAGAGAFAASWAYLLVCLAVTYWGTRSSSTTLAEMVVWSASVTGVTCALAWGLGALAHRHQARIGRLERARRAAGDAVRAERARIASDLNGIIRVSVYGMLSHAAAARQALRGDRGRAREAFAAVESIGVEAMHELRRLLHVLHDEGRLSTDPGATEPDGPHARVRRMLRVDRSDVLVAASGVLASVVLAAASFPARTVPHACAYLAVVLWVLLWRRRFPGAVFVLVIAGHASAVLLFNRGDFVWDSWSAHVPVLLALAAVAAHAPVWVSLPALVVAYGYLMPVAYVYPEVLASNLTTAAAFVLAVWVAGFFAGRRRRHILQLEAEVAAAARAVDRERAGLASDLHDMIGHAITVMVLQAAGARRIIDQDPERAARAVPPIEQGGADALRELDALVRVLESGDEVPAAVAPERPRGLADIGQLVARVRSITAEIAVEVEGEPRHLEPSVDLAAYCVVREALANAAKHDGDAARVLVAVAWSDRSVRVRVGSAPAASAEAAPAELSGGFGLAHLDERVRLAGGELTWASDGGVFTVEAVFPLARTVAPAGLAAG
ncbi:histidine kinase [Microbacterium sp. NPDC096154]|uniref:sensor histidine kinase n=1 Tax=Microbacterium sp. NPDC096154 TaxID=3155549 RepID=UPI0033213BC0